MNIRQISIRCKGTNSIPLNSLQNFQGNLKELRESEYKKLRKSIEKYGFRFPVFVWKNFILDGHQRIFTIKKMVAEGWSVDPIPIVEIEAENEKEAKRLVLLVSSRYGHITDEGLYEFIMTSELDFNELKEEVDLPEIDLKEFEENYFTEETKGDDEIPEEVEPITKTGDLYELGNHRLLCGDSTKREDVERLMDGKKADMVFTDPPYEINVVKVGGGGLTKFGKVGGDKLVSDNYYRPIIGDDKEFDPRFLLEMAPNILLFGGNYYSNLLPNSRCWLIWDKTGENYIQNNFADCEIIWTNLNSLSRIYRCKWRGLLKESGEDLKKRIHPTQKPIKLLIDILKDYSNKDWIVLDLFLGSGSTLIACEKTKRICYGMEIDLYYCDVIIERYKQFCIKNKIEKEIKRNGEVIWP